MLLGMLGRAFGHRCYSRPVFVVGTGRSGTTALKSAVGAHSAVVACQGESPGVSELAAALFPFVHGDDREYFRLSTKLPLSEVEARLRRMCTETALGPHWGLRAFARKTVGSRKWPAGIERWCAKTFPTEEAAACLLELYDNARFLYIVRNGMEVVYSRTKYPSMRHLPFEAQCQEWAASLGKYRYLIGHPRALVVRHEDLVRQPGDVLTGIFSFLGLAPQPGPQAMLRTTLIHSLGEPTKTDVDVGEALGGRHPGYDEWGAEERLVFKRVCGEGMDELGYEVGF